jgi:hypothetical protein
MKWRNEKLYSVCTISESISSPTELRLLFLHHASADVYKSAGPLLPFAVQLLINVCLRATFAYDYENIRETK